MFLSSSTLASLRFFEAAARVLSFKEAALELHVTQGAVSQQIKHLEEALGCRLFYRMPRRITLTEEGRRFAAVVRQALQNIEQEARELASSRSSIDIRVRTGPSFALLWLVPRLGEFYAAHPHIKLSINAAYGYFDPAHRDFDLAIEMLEGKLPLLRSEPLMDEYLMPVCSPEYAAKHPLKNPKDLARCTLLHDVHPWAGADENAEWRHWLRAVGTTQVDSTKGQFFNLAHMSIEAALGHQGVAMGRASLIKESIQEGRLVTPFKRRIKSPVKHCLVYPKELADRPEIRSVIEWLHEQAESSR